MANHQQDSNTETTKQDQSQILQAPSISLPKGGGAIKGIGEKFSANPVTGTGSMSVPIALSPGRAGFGPQLTLNYDSGAGNGIFGLGWSIGLPSVSRKTDKGLPRYLDAQESDIFLLAGTEDLVPAFIPGTTEHKFQKNVPLGTETYNVYCYRPRIEGSFALIERWVNTHPQQKADCFWRTISRDNITSWFGRTELSRIFDPADETHIFQWLLDESQDDKGNVIQYVYKPEDSAGVLVDYPHESNRTINQRTANRYLSHILYGNTLSHLDDARWIENKWMFEVVFDYGDYPGQFPSFTPGSWDVRSDPFSSYRSGFEIRTYRLCQRVLMFHRFEELGEEPYLVKSTDFNYQLATDLTDPNAPGYCQLTQVTHQSYEKDDLGLYHSRQLPPVEFTYSKPIVNTIQKTIAADQLENLPVGTQGQGYQWVDLDGEGLSGVLSEQGGAWHYKPNHGDGQFGPSKVVASKPAMAALSGGGQQLMDLAGDGEIDLVDFSGPTPGFHERTIDYNWKRFIPFASLPNIDWNDANLRFLDLTGDGHADALITEQEVFTWYPSLEEKGFDQAQRVRQSYDEEEGPKLVFSDSAQTIFLADMCGDGLTDLVRIRNGETCYWPNLGYGKFGAKITLDNSPRFDHSDIYDPRRIRLADIDGSGPIDIIYLGRHGARLYFNRSGNSLSNPLTVDLPIATDNLAAVQVADLLGNGTACLIWNSHLPADTNRPVRYIDLMGSTRQATEQEDPKHHAKPHLLIGINNNLGATTEIQYTPSTQFYIQDKLASTPWITRLPFPVHCVSKVTVRDKWRNTQFSSSYSYHHGYFDGIEREFRGFGRIEQVDIEDYGKFAQGNKASPYITDDQTLYQPPILTITWYHTGASIDRQRILSQLAHEYFPARYASSFQEKNLSEPVLPENLDADEWREAHRACKGMLLRQESYELDVDALHTATPKHIPVHIYSAATHNCNIQQVQKRGANQHAVFLVTESEALSYQYELDLRADALTSDPRISHTLNLRHDEYGNPQQSITIGYGRLAPQLPLGLPSNASLDALFAQVQSEQHIAYTETRYTQDCVLSHSTTTPNSPIKHYRLRLPCEVRTYELKGIRKTSPLYFSLADFRKYDLSDYYSHQAGETAPSVPVAFKHYHEYADGSAAQKRLVEHARTLYFDDADGITQPTQAKPFGQLGPRGLKYEDYKLALTESLLNAVFQSRDPTTGNLIDDKLAWNVDAGMTARQRLDELFDPNKPFYLNSGYIHGEGIDAALQGQYWMRSGTAGFASDANLHFYLPEEYTDPFGNKTTLAYDGQYDLFIQSSADALGNTSNIQKFDYRVLAPREMVDANNNHTEVIFDVLGLPTAMAVKGKGTEGDSLAMLHVELELRTRIAYFSEDFDLDLARHLLGTATARHIYYFGEVIGSDGQLIYGVHPPCAGSILREQHLAQLAPDQKVALQVAFEYSDGSGNILLKKARAEAALPNNAQSQPAQRLIDDFSSGDFHKEYPLGSLGDITDQQAQTGTMLGGERYMTLMLTGEAGKTATLDISSRRLHFTSEPGLSHRMNFTYGTTYIRYVPLSIDLSSYNALRFHILEAPRGLNFNVLLYFRGQADNYAQLGVNIGLKNAPFDLDFNFDSFRKVIADPTRPADFSQLSGIYIVTQSGGAVAGGGESFVIGSISAVSLPRWITSGKTILNNKGKPVKQYEPYFTDSQVFEEPIAKGVTPVIYYDAAGRTIRTEMPDGTFSRIEFSSWHVLTFDANDTVLESQWYQKRGAPDPSQVLPTSATPDTRAAWLAAHHANTPAITILDSLGRDVISIAHNRTPNAAEQWQDEYYTTYTKLDAEGKPLWIRDARGNLVMQYINPPKASNEPSDEMPNRIDPQTGKPLYSVPCYDIAGNLLFQRSMDAGDRWTLNDAAGKPMFAWDVYQADDTASEEKRLYSTEYDALHRPTALKLKKENNLAIVIEKFDYQDAQPSPANNLNGQLVRHYDPSGLIEKIGLDFKGNPLEVHRRLVLVKTSNVTDWQGDTPSLAQKLSAETFVQITEYDALNRMARLYNWHRGVGSNVAVYETQYSERGTLVSEKLIVQAERNNAATGKRYAEIAGKTQSNDAIQNIRYDAKGQRQYLKLGNGTITHYDYDPETFRLRQLRTTRLITGEEDPPFPTFASNLKDSRVLQQLHYSYDPVGNITEIYNQAFEPVFFQNQRVDPVSRYEYDALYRLTSATGRESAQGGEAAKNGNEPAIGNGFPITDQTLRTYQQKYQYDAVGNFLTMQHIVPANTASSWTRRYQYAFDDPQQPASNRLWRTWQGSDTWEGSTTNNKVTYHYDSHGSMLNLADVPVDFKMQWDHRDMIAAINLGNGFAYYQYDAGKQRTRKWTDRTEQLTLGNKQNIQEERIYLDGLELYRRWLNGVLKEEIETLHLFDGEQRLLMVDQILETDNDSLGKRTLYRYTLSNHLGSSTVELDEQAEIISYEEYHPYGTSAYRSGRNVAEVKLKRYRYTGMERDEESGLSYHTTRYYLPWLGRWGSFDSVTGVSGVNRYLAFYASPVVYVDSTGNSPPLTMNGIPTPMPPPTPTPPMINPASGAGALATGPQLPVANFRPAAGTASSLEGASESASLEVGGTADIEALGLGGILPNLVALAVISTQRYMCRTAAVAKSGNIYGIPKKDFYPDYGTGDFPRFKLEPQPGTTTGTRVETQKTPKDKKEEDKIVRGRIYVTYIALHPKTGAKYAGRTDMPFEANTNDLSDKLFLVALANKALKRRYQNDKPGDDAQGWGNAQLDTIGLGKAFNRNQRYKDEAYHAMRGREQMLADALGGTRTEAASYLLEAKNDEIEIAPGIFINLTGNDARPVGRDNPCGPYFHYAAVKAFDEELWTYTGDVTETKRCNASPLRK